MAYALSWDFYLDRLREDSDAFSVAARSGMGREVPSCPGWRVEQLVAHLTDVHYFWGQVAEKHYGDYKQVTPVEISRNPDPIARFEEEADRLIRVLEASNEDIPVWTWSWDKTIGFVKRRMAHETSVHRWDCESASSQAAPINETLAEDGVAEIADTFFPTSAGEAHHAELGGDGSIVRLRCEPGRTWDVRLGAQVVETLGAEEAADPSAVISGSPSDLVLLFWRRKSLDEVTVEGDRKAAEQLVGWLDLD